MPKAEQTKEQTKEQAKPEKVNLADLKPGDVIAFVESDVVAVLDGYVKAYELCLLTMKEAAIAANIARQNVAAWWHEQEKAHGLPRPEEAGLFGLRIMAITRKGQPHPVGTIYVKALGAGE